VRGACHMSLHPRLPPDQLWRRSDRRRITVRMTRRPAPSTCLRPRHAPYTQYTRTAVASRHLPTPIEPVTCQSTSGENSVSGEFATGAERTNSTNTIVTRRGSSRDCHPALLIAKGLKTLVHALITLTTHCMRCTNPLALQPGVRRGYASSGRHPATYTRSRAVARTSLVSSAKAGRFASGTEEFEPLTPSMPWRMRPARLL
jgi:hypothetical protein